VSFLLPKSRTETVEIAAHLLDLFIGKTSWNPDSSIASEYRISKQLPTTQKHFRFPSHPARRQKRAVRSHHSRRQYEGCQSSFSAKCHFIFLRAQLL